MLNPVYFDYTVGYGVNATFPHAENIYFSTMSELKNECFLRFFSNFELIEITSENYQQLVLDGVFGNV